MKEANEIFEAVMALIIIGLLTMFIACIIFGCSSYKGVTDKKALVKDNVRYNKTHHAKDR